MLSKRLFASGKVRWLFFCFEVVIDYCKKNNPLYHIVFVS